MEINKNQKFVIANLKQSGSLQFFNNWIQEFQKEWANHQKFGTNLVICPPFPFIELFHRRFKENNQTEYENIYIGAQNVSSKEELENTGEVSAASISDLVKFSILGHSERKENFDEVKRKYELCLKNKIIPIVCFYQNMSVYQLNNCIFAYEDPKSISKEGVFKQKNFNEMVDLASELRELFEGKSVLYGGSVNTDNIEMIKNLGFFKGVLVGRVSLEPTKLIQILSKFD